MMMRMTTVKTTAAVPTQQRTTNSSLVSKYNTNNKSSNNNNNNNNTKFMMIVDGATSATTTTTNNNTISNWFRCRSSRWFLRIGFITLVFCSFFILKFVDIIEQQQRNNQRHQQQIIVMTTETITLKNQQQQQQQPTKTRQKWLWTLLWGSGGATEVGTTTSSSTSIQYYSNYDNDGLLSRMTTTTTTTTASRNTKHNMREEKQPEEEEDSCHYYLAESAIPNGGLGLFTTYDIKEGEPTQSTPDICIFIPDFPQFRSSSSSENDDDDNHVHHDDTTNNKSKSTTTTSIRNPFVTHSWTGPVFFGQFEGTNPRAACEGTATLVNSMPLYNNNVRTSEIVSITQHVLPKHQHRNSLQLQERSNVGANTNYYGISTKAVRDVPAGSEITIHYYDPGEYDLNNLEQYVAPTRTVDWIRHHGMCADNIIIHNATKSSEMGRGAFAKRYLPKGSLVVPAPVQVFMNRNDFQTNQPFQQHPPPPPYYKKQQHEQQQQDQQQDQPYQTESLFVNYCFQIPGTDILVYPYGPGSNLINHAPSAFRTSSSHNEQQKHDNEHPQDEHDEHELTTSFLRKLSPNKQQRQHHQTTTTTTATTTTRSQSTPKPIANVKVQWSQHYMHHGTWLELPLKQFQQMIYPGGIVLEYIALRDIQPGEELFLDYGMEWEVAYEQHIEKIQLLLQKEKEIKEQQKQQRKLVEEKKVQEQKLQHMNKTTSTSSTSSTFFYQYEHEINRSLPYYTIREQANFMMMMNNGTNQPAYGTNLRTVCKTPNWDRNVRTIMEWYDTSEQNPNIPYIYCTILERKKITDNSEDVGDSYQYTVALHFDYMVPPPDPIEFISLWDEQQQQHNPKKNRNTNGWLDYIDTKVPHHIISFVDLPYYSDLHLPSAFRHPMMLPMELVPKQWIRQQ